MINERYKVPKLRKMLIFQILIFFVSTFCGLTWTRFIINREWDKHIYKEVSVSGLHLHSRSIKEDEDLIKTQYIDPLLKKNITVVINSKSYTIEISKLIKDYTYSSLVIKSSDLNDKTSLLVKEKILKKGVSHIYCVNFNYNKHYINSCFQQIEKDINREAVNASVQVLNHENVQINSSSKGFKLDETKLERQIIEAVNTNSSNDKMIIRAPIVEPEPTITTQSISQINSKIASFNTDISLSSDKRVHNIELAASLINGKILLPGETFSFNDTVGERTEERGFQLGPVINGDKIDSGIGGGVCQVSTTLYNAILKAGMVATERAPHSLTSTYVPLGLDATVSFNTIDFKFQNTLGYPIYIEAYTEDESVYINIYSNSSLLNKNYVIVTDESDSEVTVIRDTYQNDELIASDVIYKQEY